MVARLEKNQDGYIIPLTAEMVESLHLFVGAAVEVTALPGTSTENEVAIEYISSEAANESYERSKAKFGNAYKALAK